MLFNVARFAEKLEFGAETGRVIHLAIKLSKSMDRDFIRDGRRPAGICAASLFIAARICGFNRTIREIVLVVKVCEGTLRNRLKEFGETEAGQVPTMSAEAIAFDWHPSQPPSFKHPRKRKTEKEIAEDEFEETKLMEETKNILSSSKDYKEIGENEDEDLSYLDSDPEVDGMVLDSESAKFKEAVWLTENQDWLDRGNFVG